MPELDLLCKYPKLKKPIKGREKKLLSFSNSKNKDLSEIIFESKLIEIVRTCEKEYFDGDRVYGYGGYYYNPSIWPETVKLFRDHYILKEKARVLDVGCAKGFMMYDFKKLMPKMDIRGIDISQYAYDNAIEEMKPYMTVGSAKQLPYPDNFFDLVISINSIDHLPLEGCIKALKEIIRVSKKNIFISVHAWKNEEERKKLYKWNITAQTCMNDQNWKLLFKKVSFEGDYKWFVPN
jgi:SAM-dependent methyltransferase